MGPLTYRSPGAELARHSPAFSATQYLNQSADVVPIVSPMEALEKSARGKRLIEGNVGRSFRCREPSCAVEQPRCAYVNFHSDPLTLVPGELAVPTIKEPPFIGRASRNQFIDGAKKAPPLDRVVAWRL